MVSIPRNARTRADTIFPRYVRLLTLSPSCRWSETKGYYQGIPYSPLKVFSTPPPPPDTHTHTYHHHHHHKLHVLELACVRNNCGVTRRGIICQCRVLFTQTCTCCFSLPLCSSATWSRSRTSASKNAPRRTAPRVCFKVLRLTGTKRMFVGHTPQRAGINSAADGQIWRLDTGMTAMIGGRPEVGES